MDWLKKLANLGKEVVEAPVELIQRVGNEAQRGAGMRQLPTVTGRGAIRGAAPQPRPSMPIPMSLRPQGMPEDAAYIPSYQGYSPINADIANFRSNTLLPQNDELNVNPQGFSYGLGLPQPLPGNQLQGSLRRRF